MSSRFRLPWLIAAAALVCAVLPSAADSPPPPRLSYATDVSISPVKDAADTFLVRFVGTSARSLPMIDKPGPGEYASFYAGYISRVPAGNMLDQLEQQVPQLRHLAAATSPAQETFRYAENKWSVREVIGHLTDGERVFGYRAFRIGRGDQTPLSGFDENQYIAASDYHRRAIASLADEFGLVRAANLAVFRSLAEDEWRRIGTANGHPISVRALAFIMVGHVNHHLAILRERYGLTG